jgi:hypothetical protein
MKRLAILASLAFAACGGATPVDKNGDGIADYTTPKTVDSVTAVAPSTPKGYVNGRVMKMDGTPLPGVSVTLSGKLGPDTPTDIKTDANGLFMIDQLTAGSTFGLFFKLDGYAPAWTFATIPASTGNFPLDDATSFVGNIELLPISGSVTFYVVGYDGKPIDVAGAVLDVSPGFVVNRGNQAGAGDIQVTASAAAGTLTFDKVPKLEDVAWMSNIGVSVSYTVYVPPVYDATAGLLYSGKVFTSDAKTLLTQPWTRTLVLPAPTDLAPLQIVATNVANLMSAAPTSARNNLVPKTGPLYVVFNQPIAKSVFVEVRNDEPVEKDSAVVLQNPPTLNALGTELQVTFKTTPGLSDGQKYNITIQAMARDNVLAKPVRFSAPFFGGDPATPKQLGATVINLIEVAPANNNWDSGNERIEIVFDKYIGRIDAAPVVPIYFDNDLNANLKTGDIAGEKGSGIPLCIAADEPVPGWLAGARASSYSRKFTIPASTVALGKVFTATELSVTVAFNEAFKCATGSLETVWGDPLSATYNTLPVTAIPPPPP